MNPGAPERMLQSTCSSNDVAMKKNEACSIIFRSVIPKVVAPAVRGQRVGDPAAIEPVL